MDFPARKPAEPESTVPPARRAVPAWRTGKPDAFLAAAQDSARTAIESITSPAAVGAHQGARSEGDRLVTHLFECRLAGYPGWQWYAVLTRNSRSKSVTVNELGLLPSEMSVLAPVWVPWAERVRPEDAQDSENDSAGDGPAAAGSDDLAGAQSSAPEGDDETEDDEDREADAAWSRLADDAD